MKRKLLTILSAVIAVMLCVFALAACGGKGGGNSGGGNGNNNNDDNNNPPPIENVDDGELYETWAGVYRNDDSFYAEEFIVLTEEKVWYDNTGVTGKYKITQTNNLYDFELYGDLSETAAVYVGGRLENVFHDSKMSIGSNDYTRDTEAEIPELPKSLEYELSDDGEFYIVSGIGEATGDIVVPKKYRYIPIKEIADRAFYNNRALTSIEVPATVTTIGEQTFAKCANLTSAKIEAPITELTEEFFGSCTKLTNVHIPKTVTEINYRAFKDCENVKNVYYGGTVKDWASIKFGISSSHASSNIGSEEPYWANPISGEGRRLIINDATVAACSLDDVNDGAFFQYKYLTSVSARTVGDYAFYNSSITSFVGSGDIGVSAFENCYMLLSVEFNKDNSDKVEYDIKDMAFCNCTQLAAVSLGNNVRIVGEYAFAFCEKLTNITIPHRVVVIEQYAFIGSGLESVSFESIADWIIEQNNEQKYFSICNEPSKAAEYLTDQINGYAAYDWSISGIVFRLKNDGTYRVIPADSRYNNVIGVNGIGNERHRSPAHLNIPSTYNGKAVTEIYGSFNLFKMLKSMFIPASITAIRDRLYVDILYCETASRPNEWDSWFNYHANYRQQYPTVWNCKNNDKDQDGYAYTVIDNVTYRLKNSVAEAYCYMPSPKNEKSLIIPQYVTYKTNKYKVTRICNSAFSCSWYRGTCYSIVIPDGVTSIGDNAFCDCVGSVDMPSSVTDIERSAFYGSSMDIVFHGTKEQFDTINLGDDWHYHANLNIICENARIEIWPGGIKIHGTEDKENIL